MTASQALLDAAVQVQADVVLVHHGYFWKNEDARVVGMKQRRLKTLLSHDISLLAYHLPLDVHPDVGNNVQLAALLGLSVEGPLEPGNPRSVGLVGSLPESLAPGEFKAKIGQALGREPLMVDGHRPIQRVACTGAAQVYIEQAVAAGVDAYITGEISEPTAHVARENGLSFFAAGHHATERCGCVRWASTCPAFRHRAPLHRLRQSGLSDPHCRITVLPAPVICLRRTGFESV